MARKRMIDGVGDMQSIVNNFKSVPDTKLNAGKMKFCLHRLKESTGLSEQALILRMLFFAFDNSEEFAEVRPGIIEDWENN